MDQGVDSLEDKCGLLNTQSYTRSPTFSSEETNYLIHLVEEHKNILFNPSTNAVTSHAKNAVWLKICNKFNKQNFKCERDVYSLRKKWDNLKKSARNVSKSLMDIKHPEYNDVTCRVIALLCDSLNAPTNDSSQGAVNDNNDSKEDSEVTLNEESWIIYSNNKNDITDNGESDDDGKRINRALNFTPQECKLLLQCVKPEKKYVFSKLITAQGLRLKNQAWERITDEFNKKNHIKRSTKVLRTKFSNMKYFASKQSNSQIKKEKIKNVGNLEKVKKELSFSDDKLDVGNSSDEFYKSEQNRIGTEFILDPLSTVLNEHETEVNVDYEASASKEVNRFQIELLKYKLETAKLERQRVEAALEAEKAERDIRTVENALRLRAARLNVVAAEMGLPRGHQTLQYTQNEIPAKDYLTKGLENSLFN